MQNVFGSIVSCRCSPASRRLKPLFVRVCVRVCSGMRQGNDVGTTYRSAIYTYTQQQLEEALASKDQYQKVLSFCSSLI